MRVYEAFLISSAVTLEAVLERETLTADVVYSGLGLPRVGGAVAVQYVRQDARILMIDSLEAVRRAFPSTPERYVGFALSPPPVNAHTHLDLSTMPFSPGPYERFIRKATAFSQSGQRNLAASKLGLAELETYGTPVIGDIVTDEDVMRFLLASNLKGVAYWKVIDPDPARAEATFYKTVKALKTFKTLERPGGVRVGLAPHTPHTVSAPLLQKLAALAEQNALPLQIHLAETPGEVALHRDGKGPLMEMYHPFLPDWTPSGLSPVGYLESIGVLDARPTLVHMVHVSEQDVRDVQKAGCAVVHCPRSNEALDCGRFPWALYAKHGVTVAFGTDSLGSSPSLAIEEEVAFARNLHGTEASAQALAWSAVKGGYRALNMEPPKVLKGDPLSKLHIWGVNADSG